MLLFKSSLQLVIKS
jgi:hypothetical protein